MVEAKGGAPACVFQGLSGEGLIVAVDETGSSLHCKNIYNCKRSTINTGSEMNENILTDCSLELAEDVSIFCRDAGGLQDSHPKGKKIANPQVLQRCVKRVVRTGLQRNLRLICASCDERKIKNQTQVEACVPGRADCQHT